MAEHYVYLLIDPRKRDEPFYIGQGQRGRALDHVAEAKRWVGKGKPDLVDTDDGTSNERRAKLLKILDIVEAGLTPQVDLLRTGLSKREADIIESASIDLLGLDALANLVPGPDGGRRVAAKAFETMLRATAKPLISRAVVVAPTQGLWGGADTLGGLIGASGDDVLENAWHIWKVSPWARARLLDAIETRNRPVLAGIQSGPSVPYGKGVVVGLWEISAVVYEGPKTDRAGIEADGYAFVIDPQARLAKLRKDHIGHRLLSAKGTLVSPQPGLQYINL